MANNALYDRWFQVADSDRDGRVTGKDAVQFFEKSGLPRDALARVWELANDKKLGFLDRACFYKAMDLMSLAQQGTILTAGCLQPFLDSGESIPAPKLAGMEFDLAAPSVQGSFNNSASSLSTNSNKDATFNSIPHDHGSLFSKKKDKRPIPGKVVTSIIDGLKQIYFSKVRPLEELMKFGQFFGPFLNESDFEAKPSVLLLGQYSTGKTTFIKYLLGRDYPGSHIGPEPTTDRFVVVYGGAEERRMPGNTLAVQPDKPYQGLNVFGTGFLSRFEGSQCPAALLDEITLVDTPGVLSGEKQRLERNYNFCEICEWFAARCDLILLLFDPYKLDISDEFKQVIAALRGHDDKVRVILNKADQVDQQQLMRVYGALMWALGKVFKSPEVCKVYVGSFNSEAPINEKVNPYGKPLFEAEQKQLLSDLYDIPQRSCDRKINEFVKRVRAVKIHILLVNHLRKQMPSFLGKEKAQKKLLEDIVNQFRQVQREHHLPVGDFPDPTRFRDILQSFDLDNFPKLHKAQIQSIDDVLSKDIPALVKMFDNPFP
mmetsp:Transcript_11752/g.21123  ORF Transcript_11752/g.21123 Transcript_11752/m.21123 type:complete len:544 (-) Transcript_11752:1029-2660(-)|eukprot:CAMPEP_0175063036 /NCGR_PEP_ID=MMETSP0052_2-20121109/14515_1 /TAXON_ID=51329 ORGANISM="Polytomella parva, Strain SAG 63-3" /NCGR_SAMPLE_ID=MMETSP0052_2 /ASSEMBLY_ACC=CAM_ASM_000194 /LENGTH=543 /DNA_ID=CAMNT_0016329153 /DNA_START=344 /DNA_END=1975 /DNA_ORIENTATION=+